MLIHTIFICGQNDFNAFSEHIYFILKNINPKIQLKI